jgi:hypothetical protein
MIATVRGRLQVRVKRSSTIAASVTRAGAGAGMTAFTQS